MTCKPILSALSGSGDKPVILLGKVLAEKAVLPSRVKHF